MDEQILDRGQETNPTMIFATFWERVGASLVDGLIMLPVFALNFYNLVQIKSLAICIICSVAFVIYKIYMEGNYGATLGKRAMKIKVVSESGGAINSEQAGRRAIFYLLSTMAALVSSIMVFNTPDFVDMHDFLLIGKFQQEHGLPFDYLFSIMAVVSVVYVAFDKQRQALHDKFAKTYCIKV